MKALPAVLDNEDTMDAFEAAIGAATAHQLDGIAKAMWASFARGEIDENRATALSGAIDARREARRVWADPKAQNTLFPHLTHPAPKQRHSRVQSASMERRRRVAMSGAIPSHLAAHFTMGELAVLSIIAAEVKRSGACAEPMDKIAALAGVCRTTARNALRLAARLQLVSIEERRFSRWRSDTNLIRIVSGEWRTWLRLGGGGRKKAQTTDTNLHIRGESVGVNGEKFPIRSCRGRSDGEDCGHETTDPPLRHSLQP